jgi:hypothetical protein
LPKKGLNLVLDILAHAMYVVRTFRTTGAES